MGEKYVDSRLEKNYKSCFVPLESQKLAWYYFGHPYNFTLEYRDFFFRQTDKRGSRFQSFLHKSVYSSNKRRKDMWAVKKFFVSALLLS